MSGEVPGSNCGEGAQRNLLTRGGLARRYFRADRDCVWNCGFDFQNHVILIELREDGRYLALAECVVKRVVDVCG